MHVSPVSTDQVVRLGDRCGRCGRHDDRQLFPVGLLPQPVHDVVTGEESDDGGVVEDARFDHAASDAP